MPETPGETISSPETYEDYMKLAAESYDRQDWETALACYQTAKKLDDGKEEVYRGLSDVYLQMDDVEQALAVLGEGAEKCNFDSLSQKCAEPETGVCPCRDGGSQDEIYRE